MKVYQYEKCDSCRKALAFLNQKGVAYEKLSIVTTPPTKSELKRMLGHVGDVRKLFNTSGLVYREKNLSKKLPTMSEDECLDMLAADGMLVKRPFILTPKKGVVGFKEDALKALLTS